MKVARWCVSSNALLGLRRRNDRRRLVVAFIILAEMGIWKGTVHHERVLMVDEVLIRIILWCVRGLGWPSRKTIWTGVLRRRDMDELKREEEDASNPAVDRRRWLQVRVVDHTLQVARIDFEDEVVDSDEIALCIVKCAKDAKKFSLGL